MTYLTRKLCKSFISINKSIRSTSIIRSLNRLKPSFFINSVPYRCFGQPVFKTHPHLIHDGEVTPGLNRAEFLKRRSELVDKAVKIFDNSHDEHIFIFVSASRVYMSGEIPYPFRQNSDFLYLCGFQEPDSILMIESCKNATKNHISTLFVQEHNAHKEVWEGPQSGTEGALWLTGVDYTKSINEVQSTIKDMCHLKKSGFIFWYNYQRPVNMSFHDLILQEFAIDVKYRNMEDPTQLLHQLRLIKSPAEINLMKKSAEVVSNALIEVMKFSEPNMNESLLCAKVDYECRKREAEFLAYPPVVAGGERANIIHYTNNNQIIQEGDMVLMDAGCEYHGYTSDITRTWPISGSFTSSQKLLYKALLSVQISCIQLCTIHMSLDQVYHAMLNMIGLQLQKIGLIDQKYHGTDLMQKATEFCPHHVSHYLGMDVHDTSFISRSRNLQAGMIVTVEPGIYISKSNMSVPQEFRGLGMRIEDDILITNNKPIVLSAICPKTVEDIELLLCR